ncbi:MAG TPA: hypothetical protein ENK48_03410 [Gammaproteobacteria bacterium]|nr:hypothetical protein [Gammaproteobacteria bacterium]
MYTAMPGNFSLFQNSLFGRFQHLAYKGPTVTDNGVSALAQTNPPRPSPAAGAAPAMLSGAGDGGLLAGRAVMEALAPMLATPATPAPAAGQVLDRVGQTLAEAGQRGAGPAELRDLLQQAREGVGRGVAEARQALVSMGVGDGSLMDQVDQAQEALEQGLAALEARYVSTSGTVPSSLAVEMEAASTRSLALEVTTREGDVVTLSLSSTRAFHQSATLTADGSGGALSLQGTVYQSQSLSLTVDGQLNREEMSAIQDLMKRVDRLADRFFEGDVQEAFATVMETGLDSESLLSFSLDMEMTRMRQVSSAYQAVAAMDAQAPAPSADPAGGAAAATGPQQAPALATALDTLSGLFQDMKAAMEMPALSEAFEEPGRIFRELMNGAVQVQAAGEGAQGTVEGGGVQPADVVDQVMAALADDDVDDHHGSSHDESVEDGHEDA